MKCNFVDPEKFKKGGRVQIQAWLGVMENYSHVGNTCPEIWVDIAQTCLEIRVAQNWQNIIKILEKEGKLKILRIGYISKWDLQRHVEMLILSKLPMLRLIFTLVNSLA